MEIAILLLFRFLLALIQLFNLQNHFSDAVLGIFVYVYLAHCSSKVQLSTYLDDFVLKISLNTYKCIEKVQYIECAAGADKLTVLFLKNRKIKDKISL